MPSSTTQDTAPPPSPPPPIKTTFLEDAMLHIDIETSPAPTKYCQHLATHRDPHHTHTLLELPPLPGTQPPSIIPSLPHNTYTPSQPPEDHSCSTSSLPGAAHPDAPQHSHTTQNSRALYFPAYSGPSLPPKRRKLVLQAPSRRDPTDPHTATSRKIETQGTQDQQEDSDSPDTEP
jgi:hypothetical protein